MTEQQTQSSVVVGIDGSKAAIDAAVWAIKEAVARDVPLRLVAVIDYHEGDERRPAGEIEREYARDSLLKAHEAVIATGHQVKVETEVIEGHLVSTLIRLSRSADMICVGSVGIGYFANLLLGSTAAELANSAHCPVAIIRRDVPAKKHDDAWIAVIMDDSPDSDAVLATAVEQARLRHTGLLTLQVWHPASGLSADDAELAEGTRRAHERLESRLAVWRERHPDLHILAVATHGNVIEYLTEYRKSIQLVVVGAASGDRAVELVGPVGHAVMRHANCSVLVVRS